MPASPFATRVIFQNLQDSPLGRVSLAGTIRHGAGTPSNTMRILGSFALVYLSEGAGMFRDAAGHAERLRPGNLITVFPDIPHRYGPEPNEDWSETYLVFSGPAFDLWRRSGLLDPSRPVRHFEPVAYWQRRLIGVVEPAEESSLSHVCRLQTLLSDFATAEKAGPADHDWLARARSLLEPADPVTPVNWGEVTEELDVSYEAFRKRFARLAGISPARFHARRVIDRACEKLRDRHLSSRQVASACGFCDEFHFARRFKQLVGLTPCEFRRRL
jgi:AraC-like DNA-binding protein